MAKVEIDTDKINTDLLPMARENSSFITSSKNYANNVNMPNGEYNWSSVSSQIGDCVNEANKYLNWLSGINSSYATCISNKYEVIQAIEIMNISKFS